MLLNQNIHVDIRDLKFDRKMRELIGRHLILKNYQESQKK